MVAVGPLVGLQEESVVHEDIDEGHDVKVDLEGEVLGEEIEVLPASKFESEVLLKVELASLFGPTGRELSNQLGVHAEEKTWLERFAGGDFNSFTPVLESVDLFGGLKSVEEGLVLESGSGGS